MNRKMGPRVLTAAVLVLGVMLAAQAPPRQARKHVEDAAAVGAHRHS